MSDHLSVIPVTLGNKFPAPERFPGYQRTERVGLSVTRFWFDTPEHREAYIDVLARKEIEWLT